ncbi:hypothetical protein ABK040_007355 [Willaertia magna]
MISSEIEIINNNDNNNKINFSNLLKYLEENNKSLPTTLNSDHSSIQLFCVTCNSQINCEKIQQLDQKFIFIENCNCLKENNGKLFCNYCNTQLGILNTSSKNNFKNNSKNKLNLNCGKLFWTNVFDKNLTNNLISLQGNLNTLQFVNLFENKEKEKITKRAENPTRFQKIIEFYLNENLQESSLQNSLQNNSTNENDENSLQNTLQKRKLLKRLFNLKMPNLENENIFNEWINNYYKDKQIKKQWDLLNNLLNLNFKGNCKAEKKIEEIVKGHILENLQNHVSVKKLRKLVEEEQFSEIRKQLQFNLLNHSLQNTLTNQIDENSLQNTLQNSLQNPLPFTPLNYISSIFEKEYSGKYFCFLDLSKANFSTLKTFDPSIFEGDWKMTWKDYLLKETNFEFFHTFHYAIRHPVFGKLNFQFSNSFMIEKTEREMLAVIFNEFLKYLQKRNELVWLKELLQYSSQLKSDNNELQNELQDYKKRIHDVKQCATDSFFICLNNLKDAKEMHQLLIQFLNENERIQNVIHLSLFINHYYHFYITKEEEISINSNDNNNENDRKWFVVKELIECDEEEKEKFSICAVLLEHREVCWKSFDRALQFVKEHSKQKSLIIKQVDREREEIIDY